MKFSLKEVLVKQCVKTKMIWTGEFCYSCHHKISFETMYRVVVFGKQGTDFKYFCWDCCQSEEEAFDFVFPKNLTAQQIINRQEKKKAWQVLHNLLNDISKLPDGEVSPSVYNILLQYSPDIHRG